MSVTGPLFRGLRDTLFVVDQVKKLATNVEKLETEVRNQDRRLIRLEALVEYAQGRRGPPRLSDQ